MKATDIKLRDELSSVFGHERIRQNEPLARHCNWRIGGPADLFVVVHTADELLQCLKLAKSYEQEATVLGYGANTLIADKGVRGLVVLNRAHEIEILSDAIVKADSGTNLAVLAKETAKQGVAGFEFLIGIPGTVGAAVAVNAGTRTRWMSTVVVQAEVFCQDGNVKPFTAEELDFSYRNSRLKKSGEIVIRATLQGEPDQPENIEHKLKEELKVRKTQPTGPSTGSVFTNPDGDFAGRLIEASGLKGAQVGGAKVSEMHANFILNVGGATAHDIKALIEKVKHEVERNFNVQLQEEIRYVGDWDAVL